MSFPRKFHNRFIKFSYFLTPNALSGYSQAPYEETPLKTIEFGLGSYFGASIIRPYAAFHYSGAYRGRRSEFLGLQAGLSYKRRINLEFGHFANFYAIITETPFFVRPRISLHYMINLNSLQRKAS
ncbi:hypothetical protein [Dyadobacter sp. CY323]|uniref:hypothetical protein n=1 Tax=Dyadobacter sp. CY323 TaxID=2907302 RepID=UPI001F46AE22|nr:hypothetical protein [Dyadobacter sp. CY323]MCE6992286.1 hypothetical protein [Dyadobacter sp. CY323]